MSKQDTEKKASENQRRTLYGLTGDPEVFRRDMKSWEAGTWIRRLQGRTSPAEKFGRGWAKGPCRGN